MLYPLSYEGGDLQVTGKGSRPARLSSGACLDDEAAPQEKSRTRWSSTCH